jgi:VWFA-related protein
MRRWCGAGTIVSILLGVAAAQQPPPPTAAQQRPVFRGGTHFVRVDAYPTQDGKIVEGLQAEDFEILEDGKPQKIESFDFLKFDTFTPDAVRRDPRSQRDGFDLAADPRYRVFVIAVDMAFAGATDIVYMQQPLVQFLQRMLGPMDLFGFITSRNSVKDLVLSQKSQVVESQIADLFRSMNIDKDDADELDGCPNGGALKGRHRADQTYTALEGLVQQLGSLRQERKNVVFVTNLLPRLGPDPKLLEAKGPLLPKAGITQGRVGIGDRNAPGAANDTFCTAEFQRLAMMDFDSRFRQLLRDARQENVSFYIVTPKGLQAPPMRKGTLVPGAMEAGTRANDTLLTLANETDGIAIVDTNDLGGGMKRIADDLAAYYVLGYYTTNTKFDGGIRSIKVQLKANGKAVRARRQYRAPTQAEITALAAGVGASSSSSPAAAVAAVPSPREAALVVLERANRPFAAYAAVAGKQMTVVAELSAASIQAGRWKDGADVDVVAAGADGTPMGTGRGRIEPGSYAAAIRLPLSALSWPARITVTLRGAAAAPADDWVRIEAPSGTLVGDAVAYRAGSRIAPRPVAGFEFARSERIRVEWPVLAALDRREVRLLDKSGRPLPVELPLAEDPATRAVVVEMSLSGLGHGDYLIELTAGSGSIVEKHLLAIDAKAETVLLAAVGAARRWQTGQPPPPTAAQQRPVFRGGTHFVRVDAYPMEDGKIVEGLSAEDFEILEDGKPQKIDSFDFLKFDTFTPEQERRDPVSQRAGFDMAADPRYRVFVIFVDLTFTLQRGPFAPVSSLPKIEQPLVDFLDRMLGPQDLYGFLTSRNTAHDLVLAQKSTVTRAQLLDLWRASAIDRDDADELNGCDCGQARDNPELCKAMIEKLKLRHRADATYTALHSLILELGSLRQERKNVIFASNILPRWRADDSILNQRGPAVPKVGITKGRIGEAGRDELGTSASQGYCASEFQRLANIDFDSRYRELLREARQENVAFYVITPAGLGAADGVCPRGQNETDDLVALANESRRPGHRRHQRPDRRDEEDRGRPRRLLRARLLRPTRSSTAASGHQGAV